jgi:hypothetical protein
VRSAHPATCAVLASDNGLPRRVGLDGCVVAFGAREAAGGRWTTGWGPGAAIKMQTDPFRSWRRSKRQPRRAIRRTIAVSLRACLLDCVDGGRAAREAPNVSGRVSASLTAAEDPQCRPPDEEILRLPDGDEGT